VLVRFLRAPLPDAQSEINENWFAVRQMDEIVRKSEILVKKANRMIRMLDTARATPNTTKPNTIPGS
jgi:hypothetical protein